MENRNGLLGRTMVTQADGTAERDAALRMAWKTTAKMPGTRRITLGGDKNYHTGVTHGESLGKWNEAWRRSKWK